MASISAQPAGYDYRKKLIISSAQVSGTTDLVDFPVLVSFAHNDLRSTGNGGGVANPSGYDIILTADTSLFAFGGKMSRNKNKRRNYKRMHPIQKYIFQVTFVHPLKRQGVFPGYHKPLA